MRYTIYLMEALRPIETTNIGERAYKSIEDAIVRNELAPGTLLSDRRLSQALGVSRTPVRDALQALEASGLVKRRGRVGWMVAGFDRQDARELFELRRVLEPLGLEKLAADWDPGVTQGLVGFFDGFSGPLPRERYAEYMERDHDFHKRIVGCSGNSRVVNFYGVVEKQINRIRHYLAPGYRGRMNDVVEEHRRICAAIAARDLPAAREALLDHLRAGERAMTEFIGGQRIEGGPYVSREEDRLGRE
jgi:DNA-binding GntR family transcriptional regulator